MIRVFVVDDEKLVRRGIIGLIDWEKYGMEVVGDSGNSQETLEFLKREEVDLLFSDLEMPGLSGVPYLEVGIPGILSLYFDVFSGGVQALVFSLLTMVYIGNACPPPEPAKTAGE